MMISREEWQHAGDWLHEFYKSDEGLQRPEGLWIDGHPDWEGIGAWLQDRYQVLRQENHSVFDAKQTIMAEIRSSDEWRQKHANPNPPGSSGPVTISWPPPSRAPLPPFDRSTTDPDTGASLPLHTGMMARPSIGPSVDWMRANLWGVTLPGLPPINGGARGAAQQRGLTYLMERYPPEWQDRFVEEYARRGYTHWWLSIPDSLKGPARLTIPQYVDMCQRIRDGGVPYLCHFLRSKDWDGREPRIEDVYPVVEALSADGLIDMACHAWEASLFYSPQALRTTIDSDASRYRDIRWCVHLQQGYPHFGFDMPNSVESARSFWLPNISLGVKRLLYQYKTDAPKWSAGMMQARGNDVSVRLVQNGTWRLPETVNWDAFEVVAQMQFNNDTDGDGRLADEDIGDLKGYETLCTPGPLAPSGFGNGARYPDGRII